VTVYATGAAILVAALLTSALVLRRTFLVVTVHGASMEPSLSSGDRVLVRRARLRRIRRGAMVVVTLPAPKAPGHPASGPEAELMVKRAAALPGDPVPSSIPVPDVRVPPRNLVVIGDNPNGSYDSRLVGYVPADALVGVVVRRMATG